MLWSFSFLYATLAVMLKNKSLWLGITISLVLLALVFYGTDLRTMGEMFRNANYFYVLPALALYFLGVFLRAVRWHFLLRSIKSIAYWRLFQITVIGYMVNDLLPFRIGELARAYLVGETEKISKASALVTIFLERIFDGVSLLLFIGIASLFLPLEPWIRSMLLIGTILFALAVVILVVVAGARERVDPLIHWCIKRLPERWGARSLRLVDSLFHGLSVLRNPMDALLALVFSMGAWLLEAGMYAVLALAFGINLSFPIYLLTTAVANLVTIVPSTPGYVGVFDAAVKAVLSFFGVESNLATSYVLLLHAALILPVVILGIYFTWRMGLSLGQLQKSSASGVSLENAS